MRRAVAARDFYAAAVLTLRRMLRDADCSWRTSPVRRRMSLEALLRFPKSIFWLLMLRAVFCRSRKARLIAVICLEAQPAQAAGVTQRRVLGLVDGQQQVTGEQRKPADHGLAVRASPAPALLRQERAQAETLKLDTGGVFSGWLGDQRAPVGGHGKAPRNRRRIVIGGRAVNRQRRFTHSEQTGGFRYAAKPPGRSLRTLANLGEPRDGNRSIVR